MATLKDVLEGKPLRAPLHPALVHLPLALFPLSVLLDLASWALHAPELQLVRASFVALVGGLATGLVAGVVGMVDYTDIRDDHPAKKPATAHLILNLIALGLFGLGAGLRYGELDAARTPAVPLFISLGAFAVLGYSGYLGGHLIYNDGIGVGRHRRRTRTPEHTVRATAEAGASKWFAVAEETAVAEGETLRVDVDGTIVVIARVAGGLHAFQEFCTHRYGPMSEGQIRGCEIECPWHRSRFDVRTGKVIAGPAKLDLLTFRVETRAGKIWVERSPRS